VDNEDPGFAVAAPTWDEESAIIGDEELRILGDFLPDLLQEMLRQLEGDAEGE
jgi:hypothetical protein